MPKVISNYWRRETFKRFKNHPRDADAPASDIARALEKHAASADCPPEEVDGYPSERTIRGTLRAAYRELPESEQLLIQELHWPESFELGLLPWEAAPELLAELGDLLETTGGGPADGARGGDAMRPTVRWARWYWRLRTSVPDAPLDAVSFLATQMEASEIVGAESAERIKRGIEGWFAYRGWPGGDRQGEPSGPEAHASAVQRGIVPPVPLFHARVSVSATGERAKNVAIVGVADEEDRGSGVGR